MDIEPDDIEASEPQLRSGISAEAIAFIRSKRFNSKVNIPNLSIDLLKRIKAVFCVCFGQAQKVRFLGQIAICSIAISTNMRYNYYIFIGHMHMFLKLFGLVQSDTRLSVCVAII